jgi:hypothetical protein
VGISRIAAIVLLGCGRLDFSSQSVTIDAAPDSPPDAPLSPTGTYKLANPVIYSCASGLVDENFSQLAFVDNATTLAVTSNDTGVPAQPCVMKGASAVAGHIDVTCTNAGACNEIYHLTGTFAGANTWSGTFESSFMGLCLDCTTDSVPVIGTR